MNLKNSISKKNSFSWYLNTEKAIEKLSNLDSKNKASYGNIKHISFHGVSDNNFMYLNFKTKKLIESLIDPIDNKISNILNSNFIITKIEELVTHKGKDDQANYWHFDPVPLGYGKIFFYLSSAEETDGKTHFLSPLDSFKLLKKGYNNIPLSKRSKNIKDISHAKDIKIGNKGKYMIFLSGMMLHRGSYPTFGKRKILSINFLRSNHHWKDVFDELWSIDKLSGKWIPSSWPKHNIKIDL